MGRWIDIPAHRVWEVGNEEFHKDYRVVNQAGNAPELGEAAYRIIRRDGKVYKPARFLAGYNPEDGSYRMEEV